MKTKRIPYLDIIKALAICCTLMIHVSAYLIILFEGKGVFGGAEYAVANAFNGISRVAIPLFVMTSSALLLDENKTFDISAFYRRTLLVIAILFAGWLLFYASYYAFLLPYFMGGSPDFKIFAEYLLSFKGTDYPHLWYMVFLVEFYLAVPLFRLFVKSENRKVIGWAAVIMMTVSIILDALRFAGIKWNTDIYVTKFSIVRHTVFLAYILAGWYIANFGLPQKLEKALPFSSVFFALAIVLIVNYQSYILDRGGIREFTSSEGCALTALYGISCFALVRKHFKDKAGCSELITLLSKFSFGIYMIHVFFLDIIVRVIAPYPGSMLCGCPAAYIVLVFASDFAISFLTVWILSKTRHLKKIFYLR